MSAARPKQCASSCTHAHMHAMHGAGPAELRGRWSALTLGTHPIITLCLLHAMHGASACTAAGPKAPAAGSTASRLAADDAAQLKSLLAFKAAVDGSNILKGQWTASGQWGRPARGSTRGGAQEVAQEVLRAHTML